MVGRAYFLGGRPRFQQFAEDFFQRDEGAVGTALPRTGGVRARFGAKGRAFVHRAVGQFQHPSHDAPCQRLSARRAAAFRAGRRFGSQENAAGAVAVVVVLSFLGEEFNGFHYSVGAQGVAEGGEGTLHIEDRRLPAQLVRGVGVRV